VRVLLVQIYYGYMVEKVEVQLPQQKI
jgi:hypothetical protein